MILLSPHPDDAVLGLGQYLASEPDEEIEVVTVFAGIPPAGTRSMYDASCGWESSVTAMEARRREDRDALELLGARETHWDFLDLQYTKGTGRQRPINPIINAIAKLYSPETLMFAPLGLGHPDHRFVADCALAAVTRHAGNYGDQPVGILLWEELPYRVEHPEEVPERFAKVRDEGWTIDSLPWPLEQGPRELKVAALRCYRSQLGEGEMEPMFLCPERVWRCTR